LTSLSPFGHPCPITPPLQEAAFLVDTLNALMCGSLGACPVYLNTGVYKHISFVATGYQELSRDDENGEATCCY
jgi:hypothetical protein